MTPSLRVGAPGLQTTLQDLGRIGSQRLGVPVGGALDPVALRAANALAGNAPDEGALEVMATGPTLFVQADDVRLGLAGAAAALEILPDATAVSGRRIAGGRSVRLRRGEGLRIGALSGGAALYVAVEGGFEATPALGSVSTDLRCGLGGFAGRALAAGDLLPLRRSQAIERAETMLADVDLAPRATIRAVPGPQADHFTETALADFFAATYTVGADSNRMGMRLSGPAIAHARGFDIVSDAIAPGSIQVPGSGQPIVLLADRQTTGGYPKIATVISADLPALGRLAPGAVVRFDLVTLDAAAAARRALLTELEALPGRCVPMRLSTDEVALRLCEANLISGFVDAAV